MSLLLRQDAADALGLHFAKLERLRQMGHIPEAVRVGRYFLFPADKLPEIKARLVRDGHIRPRREGVGDAARC